MQSGASGKGPEPARDEERAGPLFVGRYVHSLDDKRRVAIPKAVREALDPARDGEAFYLLRGAGDPCIWLYPERGFRGFERKLSSWKESQGGIGSKDVRTFVRTLLGSARRCEPDGQGRIVLPEDLCGLARIGREVVFVGTGDRVELWSPALLKEPDDQEFDRTARELFG